MKPLSLFPRQALTALIALFVVARATPVAAAAENAPHEFALTLLHTNDLHGHVMPFPYIEVGKSPDEIPSVGGAARRATLIRQLRKSIHNPVLLVDSGDLFTRGPLTNAYEGLADVAASNAVGYDLAAIGNNEFKAKDATEQNDAAGAQAALLQVIKRSRFPWICANARDEHGAFLEGAMPYVVREINGVRVGFLGLTAPRSASYPQTKGWSITDPVVAATEWIPKARANCDILIAVTHIGTVLDMKLAAETKGLDAIVGGDSHTFLYKAIETKNLDGVNIPIVQDGEFGADLGRFDMQFSQDTSGSWHLTNYKEELLPVRPPLAEAQDVAAAVAPYVKPLLEPVGELPQVGKTPTERLRMTNQVLVDAMRDAAGADISVNPADDGFNSFHNRIVTIYDIRAAMPFKDHVATAMLTGKEIQAILTANPKTVISGTPPGSDPAKVYKVAFVDWPATDRYHVAADKLTDTGIDMRGAVIAYLKKTYPVRGAKK